VLGAFAVGVVFGCVFDGGGSTGMGTSTEVGVDWMSGSGVGADVGGAQLLVGVDDVRTVLLCGVTRPVGTVSTPQPPATRRPIANAMPSFIVLFGKTTSPALGSAA
jgi:hypothetical protein